MSKLADKLRKMGIYNTVEAEREQCAERVRLVSRIERLRGLCKTAVGMLHDAGRDDDAEVISELIGDMEV